MKKERERETIKQRGKTYEQTFPKGQGRTPNGQ